MSSLAPREAGRLRRHRRIRKKMAGTADRPRLVVRRSHLHLYAQLIDDFSGRTLVTTSTRHEEFQSKKERTGNVGAAKQLGEMLAQKAKQAGIQKVVFDRGGYRYHGRVKALAESARSQGLEM